ncbi:MAG: hypothetical protein IKD38_04770 [Bacteroidaceae bacterium]|nr:hypothetical protein [Bacteroidaceae bacterium]
MLANHDKYARLDDDEWVRILMTVPPEEGAHRYFFNVKCAAFLKYISLSIFGEEDTSHLLGDFYEFLSADNWRVLRLYANRNGASLACYLSRCAINYFMASKRREERRMSISIDQPDIVSELNRFTLDEEDTMPPVWMAFERLSKRDKEVLRLLVIEGKSSLEAADSIWPLVKSDCRDWRSLPHKRVQDTIAMLKRRALLALTLELKNCLK